MFQHSLPRRRALMGIQHARQRGRAARLHREAVEEVERMNQMREQGMLDDKDGE